MGSADALVFLFVALADLAVIAALRRFRARRIRIERLTRSLRLAIRRELSAA